MCGCVNNVVEKIQRRNDDADATEIKNIYRISDDIAFTTTYIHDQIVALL